MPCRPAIWFTAATFALLASPVPAAADPPPWAPAHGWRAQHEPVAHVPLGIDLGRCDRALVGDAVAGVIATPPGRPLVTGKVGRRMDVVDHYCVIQILEFGRSGRRVAWYNPERDAAFRVIPLRAYEMESGRHCREYTTRAWIAGRSEQVYGTACRQPDGSWEVLN